MKKKSSKKPVGIIIPVIVAIFNVLIILFPNDIITAARDGLNLWFNNVLPSLLPFIIGTNILTGVGFVSFIGSLLEPIMQPLFGVPGCGAFPLITGMTSGYPMGGKTTAKLREKKQLTKVQAQRLVGFVNNSGPLFMLGAVGVGMFNSKMAGYFIMICHYLAAIIIGLLLKYYKEGENDYQKPITTKKPLRQAYNAMRLSRIQDGRTFGEILGDSVKNAMETIVIVGGFIILFCVIVEIFEIIGFFAINIKIFTPILETTGVSPILIKGFATGIIEITNGCKTISTEPFSKTQLLMATAIISFGGFSIHAQTISFLNKTDISSCVYILSKAIQSVLSVAIGYMLFPFFNFSQNEAVHVFLWKNSPLLDRFAMSVTLFVCSLIFVIVLTFLLTVLNKLKYKKRY